MKKRLSKQNTQGGEHGSGTVSDGISPQSRSKKGFSPCRSRTTPEPTEGSADPQKGETASERKVVSDVKELAPGLKGLVDKMLEEGSTFEDVVEGVNARGRQQITLNAVKTHFQGDRGLQTRRALRQVEDTEALLASLGKDPKSAEARLARATFLTGYSRVNRNASVVTPREAARYRMECENLNLKHQILVMQRKRAQQDLEYSRARTNLLQITQSKMKGEILRLERELQAHRAGDPIGPEVLQRIQQLYGLACHPLFYEESVDAAGKA
jgi:hypothetical protein